MQISAIYLNNIFLLLPPPPPKRDKLIRRILGSSVSVHAARRPGMLNLRSNPIDPINTSVSARQSPSTTARSMNHTPIPSLHANHILVSSMIELISILPDMATMLWPLFVLGNARLENEEHRRFILDRLTNIQKSRNLASVCRTIEAVKHSFGTRDLSRSSTRMWGHESYRYISLA